jgi:hypothetical protein
MYVFSRKLFIQKITKASSLAFNFNSWSQLTNERSQGLTFNLSAAGPSDPSNINCSIAIKVNALIGKLTSYDDDVWTRA